MKVINVQEAIEEKKKELIELIRKYDFTHNKVITCSQELDALIYHLMKK
ncbi:aspartyl-phosphate phosphatase Spo0E family protein [Bacillus sp. DX4.1]|nr:aspartyl-phosphate phosphatase Spo0E family protein [Bacillus sp. DX4.1]MDM5186378.1 aspartyl-phosphate phosphatase Spo0E family protein [Bacillus sp. DX4.1]